MNDHDLLIHSMNQSLSLNPVINGAIQHSDPTNPGSISHSHSAESVVGHHGDLTGASGAVGVGRLGWVTGGGLWVARGRVGVTVGAVVVVVADFGILCEEKHHGLILIFSCLEFMFQFDRPLKNLKILCFKIFNNKKLSKLSFKNLRNVNISRNFQN